MRQIFLQNYCRFFRSKVPILWIAIAFTLHSFGQHADKEIVFPSEAFAKLDTFESLNLEDADKLFGKKDYKGAYAAYKAYSFEFTKSDALPYVLLRMGRCLHQIDKRNAAIKAYQDVVDYFPDDAVYAAAALFYIGECHGQNGDDAKKTATWARIVKDDEYVVQPRSGMALSFLGTEMAKLGKFDEAAQYQWRTATAFLKTNPRAAQTARSSVINHYVVRSPNHDKLKEFYIAASGFDGRGQKTEKPETDVRYWSTVFDTSLKIKEAEPRSKACAYWAAKMGDRFPENDDLRKRWFDAQLADDKDPAAWQARLEKQFALKPVDINRVLKWCHYYSKQPKIRSEFFAKNGQPIVSGMKEFDAKIRVLEQLRQLRMNEEVLSAIRTTSTQGLKDPQLIKFGAFVGLYDTEEKVLSVFGKVRDKADAAKARFDYYNGRSHRNPPYMEKALAEVPVLKKSTKHSSADLVLTQARLLQQLGRFDEAIKAYQAANKQPDSTWGITDCLIGLKQYAKAVKTVQGLEAVGGGVASRAALKVADIYKIAGDKGKEVNQLRTVMKRYPKSGESSTAHNRLESYGVALIGGESEAEE